MLDAFGQPQSVVVLGGTSDIAQAIIGQLAAARRCRTVVLAGRDQDRLATAADAALGAGAEKAPTVSFDALEVADAGRVVDECFAAAGEVDLVLVAVGVLSKAEDELDPAATAEVTTAGFAWPAAAMSRAAALLVEQGHGRIMVLSSVAGVRIRRSNFVYGATKAGLDGFSLGLGEALRTSGVTVQVVRPGFVHSKMTAGMQASPMSSTPASVADAVVAGLESGAPVVWVPSNLRWVFMGLRTLPATVWRKMPA